MVIAIDKTVQQRLTTAGFDTHGIDGLGGRQTFAALFSAVSGGDLGDVALALADGALDAWPDAGIITPLRMIHYVGQAAAETGGFRKFVENLNYSVTGLCDTFPTRGYSSNGKPTSKDGKPTDLARKHARNPEMIANHVYASRYGNGDEASGDGWRYRGRGMTMVTFGGNYVDIGTALKIDLHGNPDLAADPRISQRIMARYWTMKSLNRYADTDDLMAVSRGINMGNPVVSGTPNGMPDRVKYTARAGTYLK
jgi:putative chitinase